MNETDPDDLARAASDAVDAWCAANAAPELPHWAASVARLSAVAERVDITYCARRVPGTTPGRVTVTYTTIGDQARAILDEDEVLQQCVADLVVAGAREDEARAAIEVVVEYALTKGIVRVQ